MTFASSHEDLDRWASLAHHDGDQRREVFGRMQEGLS